ncbi:MAG TPA: NADH-quinone oxidoreductase subunit L [Thermoflexus sp.]|nr:NADH-quinone oxidoreductase subunit L [Thermoflexus sp.]
METQGTLLPLLVALIPWPPFIAFGLITLFTNRWKRLSHTIAILSVAISFVLSQIVFWNAIRMEHLGEQPIAIRIPWLPVGPRPLEFGVLVDPLGAVMLFMVPLVSLMIFIYSVGYMAGDPHYSRFFALLSLFEAAMLLLVVADNLLMLFIGWEVMGFCSYALIGFWYRKPSAYRAAVKAFMTTRVGDVLMLLGIAYLYAQTGTLNFHDILRNPETLKALAETPSYVAGLSVAALASLLLFAGTVGKSAQFPLHVWLPDAMEGPTPVSAMIHAATMVSAGVYTTIRMFPLLQAGQHGLGGETAFWVVALIGAFTAFMAATMGVAQNDIKRVLAYSTISQLGYMLAAVGIGAYVAAAFHLLTHAFFKALLFLGSGSVIHAVEHGHHHAGHGHGHEEPFDPNDMFNMGGLARRMPVTFWTFVAGGLALAGFPLITAGFWSKDEILGEAFHGAFEKGELLPLLVFLLLAAAAILTGFYTMRQIALTFLGEPRTAAAAHAEESPSSMIFPLVFLAFFAIFGGYVGVPEGFPGLSALTGGNWFHEFVGGTLLEHPEALPFNPVPVVISSLIALTGLLLGWAVYARRPLAAGEPDPLVRLGPIYLFLKNRWYIDDLYQVVFVRPTLWLAERAVAFFMDRVLIDGFLHGVADAVWSMGSALRLFDRVVVNGIGDGIGEAVKAAGRELRALQTGLVQNYLLVVVLGVLGFIVLYTVAPMLLGF